jgi:sugar/nucleoside kinase (ribokinase family)
VSLVDSLGSGDAFSAGFVYKLLRDASISEACEFGNVLGALVAAKEGATATVKLDEIEMFRSQDCQRVVHPDLKAFTSS